MDTCRYTSKPLDECNCADGCKPKRVKAGEWIQPIRTGYLMQCCDCNLIHRMNFRIRKGKFSFRRFVTRNRTASLLSIDSIPKGYLFN